MQQTPMTVITEISPDSLDALKNYLKPIGENIKNNGVIQFADYQRLHYCTFFIIPGDHPAPGQSETRDILVFEANIDGDVLSFVNALIDGNTAFMHAVYRCCEDYPGSDNAHLAAYLLGHDYGANAFYVAHPGQNRDVIIEQQQIRQRIEQYIDDHRDTLADRQPAQIHETLAGQFGAARPPAPQPFLNRYGEMLFKALLGLLGLAVAGGLFGWFGGMMQMLAIMLLVLVFIYLILLRRQEMLDRQDDQPWQSPNISAIQNVEDRQLQNHLTSVIEIKPGWLRLMTLRIVLFGINLVARLVTTKGNLSGIVTIHFARWVILPGNAGGRKRLLFMSNYDGSWENYLGEFIDHASVGLTAVWSNTQLGKDRGFPDTQWLALRGGSRDEQRFKAFARNSQLPELIWYSAYSDLSVKNIANNRTVHEGLFSFANPALWLKSL